MKPFTEKDLLQFAELSGDFNPAHLDSSFARKTIFGEVAVHGIFAALKALDLCFNDFSDIIYIKELLFRFKKPIRLAKKYEIKVEKQIKGIWKINVLHGGEICISIAICYGETDSLQHTILKSDPIDFLRTPKVCEPISSRGLSGCLQLSNVMSRVEKIFPTLAHNFSEVQIAVIIATSRLVGMECPGLNSLYLDLKLSFDKDCSLMPEDELRYSVKSVHPVTSHTKIELYNRFVEGEVTAAFRPKPVSVRKISELQGLVKTDEFSEMQALIIGGSRGLGALATKLIIAGGGNVLFSYAKGYEDALELLDDMQAASDRSRSFHYDVYKGENILQLIGDYIPTHFLYFATPRIALADGVGFDEELFNRYNVFYVQKFGVLVSLLGKLNPKLSVFYPSSIALSEILPKASEYASSKAAGEMYCKHLEKIFPRMDFFVSRLPRLETDQTSSIVPTESTNSVQEILKRLREIIK